MSTYHVEVYDLLHQLHSVDKKCSPTQASRRRTGRSVRAVPTSQPPPSAIFDEGVYAMARTWHEPGLPYAIHTGSTHFPSTFFEMLSRSSSRLIVLMRGDLIRCVMLVNRPSGFFPSSPSPSSPSFSSGSADSVVCDDPRFDTELSRDAIESDSVPPSSAPSSTSSPGRGTLAGLRGADACELEGVGVEGRSVSSLSSSPARWPVWRLRSLSARGVRSAMCASG